MQLFTRALPCAEDWPDTCEDNISGLTTGFTPEDCNSFTISISEQICQFLRICRPPQQMSINITTLVTLKSSGLVRLPHPQHKLHPAWINSTPLKTFIDICRCSDAGACLSWPFSSRTPLQFNSNLELVDVGWQFETSQWDADECLHSG